MQVFLIVAPVFALIAIGYLSSLYGLLSETAHKGISEFAFSIALPALLFRTIAIAEMPALDPLYLWGAYFGSIAVTWVLAMVLSASVLRRPQSEASIRRRESAWFTSCESSNLPVIQNRM